MGLARRGTAVAVVSVVVLAVTSCSGDDAEPTAATGSAETSPSTESTTSTGATSASGDRGAGDLRGVRYCEVLTLDADDGAVTATVWNTLGLNDCPAEAWAELDPATIAADAGVSGALLNGPRYWLLDSITKDGGEAPPDIETFGTIDMFRAATVAVSPEQIADRAPYRLNEVDRRTAFTFDAGSTVYELVDDEGTVWVMQSWSQQVDPSLGEADLADLGPRLDLPEGWTYRTRVLDDDLVIDTTSAPAGVTQDDLENSYSRHTG